MSVISAVCDDGSEVTEHDPGTARRSYERDDPETGATILIALHSSRLGPASGGTRMKTYPDLDGGAARRPSASPKA